MAGGQPEPQPNNNQNSYSVEIRPNLADLGVVKTYSPTVPIAGKPLTYTVAVTNSGPTRARNVVVTDELPPGATLDSSSLSGACTPAGSTITCIHNPGNLGTLDADATVTYQIVISHTTAEIITNTVSVVSSTPDITKTNNAYTLPVKIDPDVPATLTFTTSLPGSVQAGVSFTPEPVVEILDQYGNLVDVGTGYTDTVRIVAYTDSGCTNATGTPFMNRDQDASAGVATFANLYYTKAETIYLTRRGPGFGRTGVVSACEGPVEITPGPADNFALEVDNYPTQPILRPGPRAR